jgi:hypothetical protein
MAMAAGEPPPGATRAYLSNPRAPPQSPFAQFQAHTPPRALAALPPSWSAGRHTIAAARAPLSPVKPLKPFLSLPIRICELIRASIRNRRVPSAQFVRRRRHPLEPAAGVDIRRRRLFHRFLAHRSSYAL